MVFKVDTHSEDSYLDCQLNNIMWRLGVNNFILNFLKGIFQYVRHNLNVYLLTVFLFCRPGLRSIVTGYLPSVILNSFIYIVPFAMIEMAKIAGYVSRSRKDMKACNLVFYFLVGNVFFLSLLSGSLLDQIGQSFFHPKDFPSRLAAAVSAQVSVVDIVLDFQSPTIMFLVCG